MKEQHVGAVCRAVGYTLLALTLGGISGAAFSSVNAGEYFSLRHALEVGVVITIVAFVGTMIIDTYWHRNPWGYEAPLHWTPLLVKVFVGGVTLSYLGALPIFALRWLFG